MDLFACPVCDCLPVRYRSRGNVKPICIRCNRQLVRVSKFKKGYAWALGLAGAGMGMVTIPDVINHFLSDSQPDIIVGTIQESLPFTGAEHRMAASFKTEDLLAELKAADLQWQPKEEILPNGSKRYIYKRREGEPDLSVSELQRLLKTPPTFQQERKDITELLHVLKRSGAKVSIESTKKEGAAAEWDHRAKTLRIKPKILQKGSVDFLRVLSHEAIHVAQSCKAGSLRARPEPLGITVSDRIDVTAKLKDPIYSNASHWEQQLEKEAYTAQEYPSIASYHLIAECKIS